jgi:hypothetical protein
MHRMQVTGWGTAARGQFQSAASVLGSLPGSLLTKRLIRTMGNLRTL